MNTSFSCLLKWCHTYTVVQVIQVSTKYLYLHVIENDEKLLEEITNFRMINFSASFAERERRLKKVRTLPKLFQRSSSRKKTFNVLWPPIWERGRRPCHRLASEMHFGLVGLIRLKPQLCHLETSILIILLSQVAFYHGSLGGTE